MTVIIVDPADAGETAPTPCCRIREAQEESLRRLQDVFQKKAEEARHPLIGKIYKEVIKLIDEEIDHIWESWG